MNDYQITQLFEKVEELRKQVTENETTMSIYDHLKEINKNDQLYGWMFATDDVLNDTLEDLSLYQNAYVRDVLTIYKNELENIILKAGL